MAERIDILTTKSGHGAEFIVDNTVVSVDLKPLDALAFSTLYSSDGNSIFERGDNFIVLSVGYFLPHGFTMAGNATDPIMSEIYLTARETVSLTVRALPQVGNNARILLPFENYEMSLGVFVDTEATGIVQSFILQTNFTQGTNVGPWPQVSMANVPAILNGLTLEATPFIKVLHNFPLTT